jgi:surface antigen
MMGSYLSLASAAAAMMLTGTALPAQARTVLSFVDVAAKGAQHAPYRAPTISNYRMTIVASPPARMAAPRATPRLASSPGGLNGSAETLPGYLQCAPYARQVSGIQLFGDAHTWWSQAAGHYSRGNTPRPGAVMAFRPHGKMVLGHVAAVSKVLDSRRVLLRHANWSPIAGRRGQVERDVLAMDVSPGNDWSQVRVWYDPIHGLGTTHWPVSGFIYARKVQPVHGLAASRWTSDPIGAIIAAFSGK